MTYTSDPVGREHLADDTEQTPFDVEVDDTAPAPRRRVRQALSGTRDRVADVSRRPAVRRTVPPAVIAAALLGATLVVVQRRRAAAARQVIPSGPAAWLRRLR
ncbi:hypothetical protein [Actinoplanes couchii]|uniref:Uncharacterized protein n=1 Tax=Actinoplanes couchii TaxID=403638 RepID=A0ABQ3XEJ9_9ACTN|nr:hypothetical protein [Actinoplanes couchii]MDR6319794.1 hypothetical protein [Actinoplanes couchii]GID56929.1 hypothetical protein Aco03nite_053330 [Actinoplanes couchii]